MSSDQAVTGSAMMDAAEATAEFRWIARPGRPARDDPEGPAGEGTLNVAYNALDRNVVEGRGDDDALVCAEPATALSYITLLDRVAKCAGVLRLLGVLKGSRVIVALEPGPEAIIVMLACARLGAVHVVAPRRARLAALVDAVAPAVLVASEGRLDGVDVPESTVVVVARGEGAAEVFADGRYDFERLMRNGGIQPAEAVEVGAGEPLYAVVDPGSGDSPVLTTSHAGSAVGLRWMMVHDVGVEPGDVVLAAAALEGPVGHSHGVYGPLLAGAAILLAEFEPAPTAHESLVRLDTRGARIPAAGD